MSSSNTGTVRARRRQPSLVAVRASVPPRARELVLAPRYHVEGVTDMSERAHTHHGTDDPAHPHNAPLSPVQLRVRALESLLVGKGLVDLAALDELVDFYETRVGPRNGARVVARAWLDSDFKRKLLEDATGTLAALGMIGRQGEDMVVLEN